MAVHLYRYGMGRATSATARIKKWRARNVQIENRQYSDWPMCVKAHCEFITKFSQFTLKFDNA